MSKQTDKELAKRSFMEGYADRVAPPMTKGEPRKSKAKKKVTDRQRRAQGDPCQCKQQGHGHDGAMCDLPVYGLTKSGSVRLFCDQCAHMSFLRRVLDFPPKKPSARRNEALRRAGLLSNQVPHADDNRRRQAEASGLLGPTDSAEAVEGRPMPAPRPRVAPDQRGELNRLSDLMNEQF